ncbi:MAG: hypothetical protein SOZ62_05480 [Eubacteriales bacterium]|nr:hypothetical protein [Eubacteriales bacterium]
MCDILRYKERTGLSDKCDKVRRELSDSVDKLVIKSAVYAELFGRVDELRREYSDSVVFDEIGKIVEKAQSELAALRAKISELADELSDIDGIERRM